MNFLDRTISFFNPEAGLRRARARKAEEIIRGFDAASKGRRNENFRSSGADANREIQPVLKLLRERSREQVRNNVYARRSVRTISNNVIGTGIVPTPLDLSRTAEKRTMKLWADWAGTKACDFDGLLTMYGIQRLVMRTVVESGECLVLRRRVNDPNNPIKLQVLEPDFLDHSKTINLADGGRIIQGVEFDKYGKRKGYWLFDRHPGSGDFLSVTSKFVEASEVAHIYFVERPGQVRGVPWLVTSMIRMKDFDEYEDAELVRQKIAACFTVFVQDTNPDAVLDGNENENIASRVEPGIIEMLPPGKSVSFAQPPLTNGYESYSRKILQGIAVGTDITYEQMTGDYSNVNFSSGRMGWIEFQRNVEDWQWNMIIPMLCETVWTWFVNANAIVGRVKEGTRADWTTPRREMLDPVKETNAMNLMVRNGFKSYSEAVRELGYDPDDTLEEIQSDMQKFDEKGIILDSDPRQQKKMPNGVNDNPEPTE